MARRIPEEGLQAIEAAVGRHSDGAKVGDIAAELDSRIPRRTLQYRLKYLVESGRLIKEGDGRWAKYRLPVIRARGDERAGPTSIQGEVPLSRESEEIREYLAHPPESRHPAGYNRDFLNAYRPNDTAYLSHEEVSHLAEIGKPQMASQPAGTYAKKILNRLLIDLSWNSSRLEGNNYSLLDTRRLIEFGEEAEGTDRLDTQMILNHKEAIDFLVGSAEDIGFNRYTILNLHAMLANNLLPDESAPGRLRHIPIGIEKSVFHPLEMPQLIEECFDQLLTTAAAIKDPFEQAFFIMVQLPYLQPFDDVNKRVSRLAANIPFVKANLLPLTFTDVPATLYTEAMLGVYELNRIDLFKDVFKWAYQRSAARYAAVRQSLGEPDPFRLKYREELRRVVGEVVRDRVDRKAASRFIASWVEENIEAGEREQFREAAENELLSLHEGNFARYRITPDEFAIWQKVWAGTEKQST